MSEAETGGIRQDRRPTIVDERSEIPYQTIDHNWRLALEKTRRDIVADPTMRKALIPFCSTAVSETLPNKFMTATGELDNTIAFLDKSPLGRYLDLHPIPDDLLTPDLMHAPFRLRTKEDMRHISEHYGYDQERIDKSLYDDYIRFTVPHDPAITLDGITPQERIMAALRYRFARDVKLLAMGAEILNQEGNLKKDELGQIILPSGIHIYADPEHAAVEKELLSPHLWQRKEILKDRVSVIEVNGKKYILKEKKTDRHVDTVPGGHIEGGSSEEEFEAAQDFQDTITQGDITLQFETPMGHVTYPDGFQFALFEYEEGLLPYPEIESALAQEILKRPDTSEEEYQKIRETAEQFKNDPRVTSISETDPQTNSEAQLSFTDFAIAKARYMRDKARIMLAKTVAERGYTNYDRDTNPFKVISGERIGLEMHVLDFEYYIKSPQAAENQHEFTKNLEKLQNLNGSGFLYHDEPTQMTTAIQKAAYLAMLERDRLTLVS